MDNNEAFLSDVTFGVVEVFDTVVAEASRHIGHNGEERAGRFGTVDGVGIAEVENCSETANVIGVGMTDNDGFKGGNEAGGNSGNGIGIGIVIKSTGIEHDGLAIDFKEVHGAADYAVTAIADILEAAVGSEQRSRGEQEGEREVK